MKPAVCAIFGKIPTKAEIGDWVEFSEYDPKSEKGLSHPDGLEYFCDEHIDAARRFAGSTSAEALKQLYAMYPKNLANQTYESLNKPFWKRFLGR